MDLDTTIKGLSLNIDTITKVINEIISININDNILLEIENIKKIREEEEYNGFNVNLKANFDGLKTNLMIDITTGDIITYKEIEYKYQTLFDEEPISIMTYNYETIIAEKFEAIISRNVDNTRMKDYYDLFMLIKLKRKEINPETLRKAITNTAQRVYNDGIRLLRLEYPDKTEFAAQLADYNRDVKSFWGSKVKLITK